MSAVQRAKIAEEIVRRLAASLRGAQLYAAGHPLVTRNVAALADTLALAHATTQSLTIGIVGDDLVVGETPIPRAAETMGELMRRLQQAGIERIVIDRGVQLPELSQLVQTVARTDGAGDQTAALSKLPHIRVGRLQVEQRVDSGLGDIATFRRLYDDAVTVAERLWDSADAEG